jgi:uroporphyrinogen-III synthase
MLPLHGIGVLVTRPRHQAAALCRLLEAQGASVERFAAIEIEPIEERREWALRLGDIDQFGLIIFTSANAVRYGAALLEQRRDLPLAAIGPATARALNQAGYRVSVQSTEGADSESLLRHPELNAVAGERVLLVKGRQGRELLEQELARRGALLAVAEVYRRECPRPSVAEMSALEARFAAHEIDAVTATSVEIAANLLALATPRLRRAFDAVHWVVPSARVAESLRAGGVKAPSLLARSADDQDLVSALIDWRAGESGA